MMMMMMIIVDGDSSSIVAALRLLRLESVFKTPFFQPLFPRSFVCYLLETRLRTKFQEHTGGRH